MRTGLKIGYVDDIEMDTQGANIVSHQEKYLTSVAIR